MIDLISYVTCMCVYIYIYTRYCLQFSRSVGQSQIFQQIIEVSLGAARAWWQSLHRSVLEMHCHPCRWKWTARGQAHQRRLTGEVWYGLMSCLYLLEMKHVETALGGHEDWSFTFLNQVTLPSGNLSFRIQDQSAICLRITSDCTFKAKRRFGCPRRKHI